MDFRGFVGGCRLQSDGVVPCMAPGPTVKVSGVVKRVCGCLRVLVGFAVRVWSFVLPKDRRCWCLLEFWRFESASGLHSEGVDPCMAQGPTM